MHLQNDHALLWSHAVDTNAGSYEVLRTIGTGSFGTALLVRTRSTGKLVVIKQIRLQELGTQDRLEAMNEVTWVLAAPDAAARADPDMAAIAWVLQCALS